MDRKYVVAISFIIGLSILGIFLVWLFTKGKKSSLEKFTGAINTTYIANQTVPVNTLARMTSAIPSGNTNFIPVLGKAINMTDSLIHIQNLTDQVRLESTTVFNTVKTPLFVNNPSTDSIYSISATEIIIKATNQPMNMYAVYGVFALGNANGFMPNQYTIKSVDQQVNSTTITCMSNIPEVDLEGYELTLIVALPFPVQNGTITESPQVFIEDDTTMAEQIASSSSSLDASVGGGYAGFSVAATYSTTDQMNSDNTQSGSTYKMIIKQDVQIVAMDQTSPTFFNSVDPTIFINMLQIFLPPNYSLLNNIGFPLPYTMDAYTNQNFVSRFPFQYVDEGTNYPGKNSLQGCWMPLDPFDMANACTEDAKNKIQIDFKAKWLTMSKFAQNQYRGARLDLVRPVANKANCGYCALPYICMASPLTIDPPPLDPNMKSTGMWSGQCTLENVRDMTTVTNDLNLLNLFYYNIETDTPDGKGQLALLPYLNFSDGPFCMGDQDCGTNMFCSAFDATCKPRLPPSQTTGDVYYGSSLHDQAWWDTQNIMNLNLTRNNLNNVWETNDTNGSYPSELCYNIYSDQGSAPDGAPNCPYVGDSKLCCDYADVSKTSFGFNSGYNFQNVTTGSPPWEPLSVTGNPADEIDDFSIDARTWLNTYMGRYPDLSNAPTPQFFKPTNNISILRQALSAIKNTMNSTYGTVFVSGYTLGASVISTLKTTATGTDLSTLKQSAFCVAASYQANDATSCGDAENKAYVKPKTDIDSTKAGKNSDAEDAPNDATVAPTRKSRTKTSAKTGVQDKPTDDSPLPTLKPKSTPAEPYMRARRHNEKYIERVGDTPIENAASAAATKQLQCTIDQNKSAGFSFSTKVCSAKQQAAETVTKDTTRTMTVDSIGSYGLSISDGMPNTQDLTDFFGRLGVDNAATTAFTYQPISTLLRSYINVMFNANNQNTLANPMGRPISVVAGIPTTISVDGNAITPTSNYDFNFSLDKDTPLDPYAVGATVSYVSDGDSQTLATPAPGAGTYSLGTITDVQPSVNKKSGVITVVVTMDTDISLTLQNETEKVLVTFTPPAGLKIPQNVQIDAWMKSLGSDYWLQLITLYEMSQLPDSFCNDTMGTFSSVDEKLNLTQTNFWVQKLMQDNMVDQNVAPTSTSPGFAEIQRRYICNVVNDSTCTVSTNLSAAATGVTAKGTCHKINSARGIMAGGTPTGDEGVHVHGSNHDDQYYYPNQFITDKGSDMIRLQSDTTTSLCAYNQPTTPIYSLPTIDTGIMPIQNLTTNCYGSGTCGKPTGQTMATIWDSQGNFKCDPSVPLPLTSTIPYFTLSGAPATQNSNPVPPAAPANIQAIQTYCNAVENKASCTNPSPTYTYTDTTNQQQQVACSQMSLPDKNKCFSQFCNGTDDFNTGGKYATLIDAGTVYPPVCYADGAPGYNLDLSSSICNTNKTRGGSATWVMGANGSFSAYDKVLCGNDIGATWCQDHPTQIDNPYTGLTCDLTNTNKDSYCEYHPGDIPSRNGSSNLTNPLIKTCPITANNAVVWCANQNPAQKTWTTTDGSSLTGSC